MSGSLKVVCSISRSSSSSRHQAVVQLLRTQLCNNAAAAGCAQFSTDSSVSDQRHYKLLVVGGGAGGLALASTFCRKLGRGNVGIIEPRDTHYSQATFTLVGGGIRSFEASHKPMHAVMPKWCEWIRDTAMTFDPDTNRVVTSGGIEIKYDYMLLAMGLQLNYHLIKGLPEAFEIDPMVCSNYHSKTVTKTYPAMVNFKEGNAIFTCPNTPIKCPGAAQKIIYLTEEHFRQVGKRDDANVMYNTAMGVLFGVKRYAEPLEEIVKKRGITVNFRHNLIAVKPESKEAVFENLETGEHVTFPYSMLHITPPMSTPDALRFSDLVDDTGYVTVDKETLQHTEYGNIFAIGDNTNVPTSKTAAAVASQSGVVATNLSDLMEGRPTGTKKYNGYTSCPLLTGRKKCILAEFDWNGHPMETFPINQAKERRSMFLMKKDILPRIYWNMLIKGWWRGPGFMRNTFKYLNLASPNNPP